MKHLSEKRCTAIVQDVMRPRKKLTAAGILSVCMMVVAGCETTQNAAKPTPQQTAASEAAKASAGGGAIFGQIPKPLLDKGECGLILWTLDNAERPSAVMRYMAGKEAEMIINRIPALLTLVENSGTSGFGVSEKQVFLTADGATVTVTFQFGLGFDGGSYLERGLIAYEDPEGWRTVAPAAGLAGCRT